MSVRAVASAGAGAPSQARPQVRGTGPRRVGPLVAAAVVALTAGALVPAVPADATTLEAAPLGPSGALPSADTPTACSPDSPALVEDEPAVLARLGAREAWDLATGRGVVVAVVDSGVDTRNPHLGTAVLPGTDLAGTGEDPLGHQDTPGHGTAIAGQIAARPVPGSGVVGLAPDATVLPVRVYHTTERQDVERGAGVRTDRTAEGILWAVDHGARVINVSLSFAEDDPVLRDAVRAATARGALVVASAGNRETTTETTDSPRYPAAYDEVLGVTAVDAVDQPTDASIHGSHVDVAAPGTDVLTTYFGVGDCVLGGPASTSFATAYVSAAAALVAERFPDETPAQWAYRLTATAARPDVAARDDVLGWGVIRPVAALTFVDDGSAPGPRSPVHPAPETVADPPVTVQPVPVEDRLAAARSVSAWWLLGGVGALVAASLASRLTARRRRSAARP